MSQVSQEPQVAVIQTVPTAPTPDQDDDHIEEQIQPQPQLQEPISSHVCVAQETPETPGSPVPPQQEDHYQLDDQIGHDGQDSHTQDDDKDNLPTCPTGAPSAADPSAQAQAHESQETLCVHKFCKMIHVIHVHVLHILVVLSCKAPKDS